jgi:hypothetical protein
MKNQRAGKPKAGKSSWFSLAVKIVLGCLALFLIVCIPLVSLLAFVVVPRLLGAICAMMESIGAFLQWIALVAAWVAYAIWVLLTCDWGQIVRLLPAWIGWLQSANLL